MEDHAADTMVNLPVAGQQEGSPIVPESVRGVPTPPSPCWNFIGDSEQETSLLPVIPKSALRTRCEGSWFIVLKASNIQVPRFTPSMKKYGGR